MLILAVAFASALSLKAQVISDDSKVIARVYDRQILEQERSDVTSIICTTLVERYAREKGIEATSEEIHRFRARVFGATKRKKEETDPDADDERAESAMARQMIHSWKVNLSLFREFGGRVIFQQMGPEPVDAYRDFLKQKERQGAFELVDKTLEDSFWYYFVTKNHTFISESREEGERILAVPFWEHKPGRRR